MNNKFKSGSSSEFDNLWNIRPESNYIHWTPDNPDNQIRLAFKNHFQLFKSLELEKRSKKKFIELGAGRGSLSAYYSQNGYEVTLLDTSEDILNRARGIFEHFGLTANYIIADATKTGIESNTFDVITSIGLLEHFDDPIPLFLEAINIANNNADIFFLRSARQNNSYTKII